MNTAWATNYEGMQSSYLGDGIIIGALGIIVLITVIAVLSGIGIAISNYNSARRHPEHAGKRKHGFLKGLLIYLAVIIGVLYIAQVVDCVTNSSNKEGWINPFSRTARYGDVYVSQSIEFNLSDNYTVTAHYDIKDLRITIHFFDSNDREITNKTSLIGDIKSNSKTKFSFNLNEFSASEIFTIRTWNAEVTGGNISTFAIIPNYFN